MSARKLHIKPNMKNSIDFYNFCSANNELPILDILTERFNRSFRVSLSNHLRMITNMKYTQDKIEFKNWVLENELNNCMFIIRLKNLDSPILVKFDRSLSYGMLDILTGGTGKDFINGSEKEMTQIELTLLKEIGNKVIEDLNIAWSPIHDIKAEYVRTEINPQFVGIVPPETKVTRVTHEIEFNSICGKLELLYPYSTLFPVRDKLFSQQ